MTVLCIETSTSVCSAAICKDGELIKQCICREGSNHARLLPSYIEELLSLAREQRLVIEAVALSEGPGSYTGLRIGTSTAKGLCYGLNVPLIPVPTLEVLCDAAREKMETKKDTDRLCPMIDARRMEVYTKLEVRDEGLEERGRAIVVENEESVIEGVRGLEVKGLESEDVYYFGDGAAKCQKIFTKPNWHYIPDIVPEARFVGRIAERLAISDERVDLAYYEPYYLKEFVAAQSHVKGLR